MTNAAPSIGELADATLNGRASLVVVDLDEPGSLADRHLPVAQPAPVVGVSLTGRPMAPPAENPVSWSAVGSACDIILVPLGVGPAGRTPRASWVAVGDVEAELSRLADANRRSPIASTTLMQVLRAGTAGSLEHDLVLESLAYSTLQAGPEHQGWLATRAARPRRSDAGPAVLLKRDGGALTVTLNRPEVRNAYNVAIREGLFDAFEMVGLDPSIETVHLEGVGPSFCSGGDLDEFGTGPGPAAAHVIRTARSPALGLARVAQKVTAHLHGACVGAGIEIPALAGHIVASPKTRFQLPEVSMGLIPGAGGTASIPRRIGRFRTAWLALGGAWLDAATALDWGLVDEIG